MNSAPQRAWIRVSLLAAAALAAGAGAQQQGPPAAAAVSRLERAHAAQPDHYAAGWNLALAYRQAGRWTDARKLLAGQLIPRHPQKAELRNLLAEVEEAAGQREAAAQQYQEAAHLEPSEKNIADWANHLMKYAAFDAAMKVYTSGLALHPRSIPLHIGLGAAHYATGAYDEAARLWCAAVDLDPADLRSLEFLGQAAGIAPARDAEVRTRLASFAARYPRHARARLFHGLALGDDPAAQERELRAALALDSRLAAAHQQLGILAEQQGHEQAAIQSLRRAVAIDPKLKAAHFRLSRLYRKMGDATNAERHLEAYRQLQEKMPRE